MATYRVLSLPKAGSSVRENEDAWSCRQDPGSVGWRFALADGATESSFARLWATMLVRAYAQGTWRLDEEPQWQLENLRRRWLTVVSRRPLPWYAEEKVRLGAYATFLGLALSANPHGHRWQAAAVGDTCLFHLRGASLLASFPCASVDELPLRPEAVSSRPGAGTRFLRAEGDCRSGDRFLLVTDALAHLCLERAAQGGRPFTTLVRLTSAGPRAFADWVGTMRRRGELRNDDVTLIALSCQEPKPCPPS